jgi:ketosteroid isomerase-like protein
MSRENVEMIERILGEAQHNPTALYEVLDDYVRWEVTAMNMPDTPSTYIGPEGVREFFRRWVGTFDDWGYEATEMIDAGDSVVVHIRQWGRGKGSGATVEGDFWQVWTIRDGKVVRSTHCSDKAEALEAAGLRE